MLEQELKRAVVYARVSTQDQVKGISLDDQVNQAHRWAVYKGYEIIEHFIEKGESGAKEDRTELKRMMEFIKENPVDTVYVYKADRFSRDLRIALNTKHEINQLGASIYIGDLDLDTDTPVGKLAFQLLGIFAEQERDNIKNRVQPAKMAKLREGHYISRKPYGYKVTEENQLEIIPEEAKVVKKIFHWVAFDGLSIRKVADRLNQEGYRNSKGEEWTHNSVNKILKNELYCGRYIYNGELINLNFEPIVSKQVWGRANNNLKRKVS